MDQKKIGKYIADKRRTLGLTQVQLAEKLNMSNKSVSKWERGVCLPDVSVYVKLCETLEISLNEFLAGEDLSEKEIIHKSEETIINITTESKQSRRRANFLILFLTAIMLAVSVAAVDYLNNKIGFLHKYCIIPLEEGSPEMQTVNLFPENEHHLYRYYVKTFYNRLRICYYWYKDGYRVDEGCMLSYQFSGDHSGNGLIAVQEDYENGSLSVKIAVEGKNIEYDPGNTVCDSFGIPLEVKAVQNRQSTYTRQVIIPQNKIPINGKRESAFFLMCYDDEAHAEISNSIEKDGFWPNIRESCPEIAEYDYAVFITVEFGYESPYATNWPIKQWP